MLKPIDVRCGLIVALVTGGFVYHAIGQTPSSARPADSPTPNHPVAAVHNHSIRLSWGASKPASKLSRDAVVGYNVYRSRISHDLKPQCITPKPWPDTVYIDSDVAPGVTYFYVTRGVTAKKVESGPSNEAHATVPPL